MKITILLTAAVMIFFASCKKDDFSPAPSTTQNVLTNAMISENGTNPDELVLATALPPGYQGHVYTESNGSGMNEIIVYNEDAQGLLHWASSTTSGGKGLGDGLGSQGAVVISEDHHWLFAVNAGSNSVSAFAINADGSLTLKGTANVQGKTPVSVCFNDGRLYVANTGTGDIEGFNVHNDGTLSAVADSHRYLSAPIATPGKIAFSPDYTFLIVTEQATNKISTFPLNKDGSVGRLENTNSVGNTPFGFEFSREKYLIVSNANTDNPFKASCTSYGLMNSQPMAINGQVRSLQTAACWVAVTKQGRFAFVANTGSNTLSSYFIQDNGNLYVINGVAGLTDRAPIDVSVSGDNLFVYNINSFSHTIGQFKREALGTLANMGSVQGLPDFAAGLAAF